jgi:hypothetical protein
MQRSSIIRLALVLVVGFLLGTVQALQGPELTTNKGIYNLRQPVKLTITNTGSDPVTYAVAYEKYTKNPTDWHGLTITNAVTGEIVVSWPRLLMYYKPFEPGEHRTLQWNQTYSVWEDGPSAGLTPSPLNGDQVPGGTYVARVLPDLEVSFIVLAH